MHRRLIFFPFFLFRSVGSLTLICPPSWTSEQLSLLWICSGPTSVSIGLWSVSVLESVGPGPLVLGRSCGRLSHTVPTLGTPLPVIIGAHKLYIVHCKYTVSTKYTANCKYTVSTKCTANCKYTVSTKYFANCKYTVSTKYTANSKYTANCKSTLIVITL